jgi:hypothetical protein
MIKKNFLIATFLFAVSALGAWWYFNFSNKAQIPNVIHLGTASTTAVIEASKRSECLGEGEVAEYTLINKNREEDSASIRITNKTSGVGAEYFSVPISDANDYHPIEIHHCGIYTMSDAGYDFKNRKALVNYRRILWKYNYQGIGTEVISDSSQVSGINILSDFRIDPTEKYLVLLRGYLGSPDFALVIKNIKTLKDVFILPITDIEKQNPNIVGDIGFIETAPTSWTFDGRYFWADLGDGATELGFIRVDSTDWSYKLLPAPADVLGGDALNLETGDITVHPGHVWSGDAEEAKILADARRAKGIGTNLYIENLFTHKRVLIAKSTEPNAYFHPKWISKTTLEYFMPRADGTMGERKEFVLKQ